MQPQKPYDQNQPLQPSQPGQAQPDSSSPQPMYYSRPLDPQQLTISPETAQKHEASKRKYPKLNLSDGEYVISDIRRHPIGLLQIWGIAFLAVGAILALVMMLVSNGAKETSIPPGVIGLGAFLLCVLALVGGYIGASVYRANRFYLTNESVIQNIQTSLFSNREQTVSLANIEDASYTKTGVLQSVLDYGSIRLSTEGDETTYRFHYASHPAQQVAILNNAVEAFKNGRPFLHD